MTMPTNQCPWRMQVHHIKQETPDVWTISLICLITTHIAPGNMHWSACVTQRKRCVHTPFPPRRAW